MPARTLPRGTLFWPLVLVQALVLAPHLLRVPLWIGLFWLICVGWRAVAGRQGSPAPATWLKAVLVLVAAVVVGVEHGLHFRLDPAVDMLLLAFSLKLLELRQRRDARVLLLLGYFVLAAQFLHEQSMAMVAWQLGAFILLTAGLVLLQADDAAGGRDLRLPAMPTGAGLGTATVLVVQALPLAVLLFIFFPRIDPLWAVPLPDSGARTGLSETMTPGQVARLGQSRALAFRVEFEDEAPEPAQLYWRVMTYLHYQDGSWSQADLAEHEDSAVVWPDDGEPVPDWLQPVLRSHPQVRYSVLAEASRQPWLIALDVGRSQHRDIGTGRDFRLLHREPLRQRLRYDAAAVVSPMDPDPPGWLQMLALQLPEGASPRARAWGEALGQEYREPQAIARAVLAWFEDQPFHYTLTPAPLDSDPVDRFLFETREGFCAHYAGAFVFVMRAAGVPARVVAGYHGGERNPVGSHWLVRQSDAHAWAELWLPESGWVRVDPVTAVAPGRIEHGATGYLGGSDGADGDGSAESRWWRQGLLLDAWFMLEMLEHRWNLFVLDYDGRRQWQLLERWLGQVTPLRVLGAVLVGMGLALFWVMLAWWPMRWQQRLPPVVRLDRALRRLGRRRGVPRLSGESSAAHARRLALVAPVRLRPVVIELGEGLEQALYQPGSANAGVARARRAWRQLRWQWWWPGWQQQERAWRRG